MTITSEMISKLSARQGLLAQYHRKLSSDRFGRIYLGNRLCPQNLKDDGAAFCWQLVSSRAYRVWIPRTGWSSPTTREDAQEQAYWWNHNW